MTQNPLQQFFRQPKVYIKLPSMGVYNKQGVIQGDISNLPIFGMTGMDEILMKTPDALISGESTVKVIESCCPAIKDGWDVSSVDLDVLLVAIRIATFGNTMEISNTCPKCAAENEYTVELAKLIEYFDNFYYDSKVVLPSMTIKIQPLNYRQNTNFSMRNFMFQQQLAQVAGINNEEERASTINQIFQDLSILQNELYSLSVESIEVNNSVVSDKNHINDFLKNCDADVINALKTHINKTRDALTMPPFQVKCDGCGHETKVFVNLDQSSFFARA